MRGEKQHLEIFVLATNSCNLNCRYCYETSKNSKRMDVARIYDAIRRKIEESEKIFKSISVVFHGGEPLIAFRQMRELCEKIWEFRPDTVCQMTTNGTLLTDGIRQWLTENRRRFIAVLSLDGDRASHDMNRSGSYDRIDRNFFRINYPSAEVKMTVAPNTLGRMFDNFKHLHDEGFRVNPGLANEVEWIPDRDLPIYARELNKMVDFYLDNPSIHPCKMLDIPIAQLAPNIRLVDSKGCGAGTNIAAFDVDGNQYPCHSFVADPDRPYDAEAIKNLTRELVSKSGCDIIPECGTCPIYRCCSPCFGLNYSIRGDMGSTDRIMCEMMKVNVLAAAKLYAEMLRRPNSYAVLKDMPHAELCNTANAVRFVFNNISL